MTVRLSDREPHRATHESPFPYSFIRGFTVPYYLDDDPHPPQQFGINFLPIEIFRRLTPGRKPVWVGEMAAFYPTPGDADADLSQALVAWGREEAGLPPLKEAAHAP